jgi:intraflagellar transport protein 56
MASCFFLLKQFEDVNIYMSSVKAYMYNDDDFNWNFGISQVTRGARADAVVAAAARSRRVVVCVQASVGNYKEAEETLLLVQNEKYQADPCYLSWLARCYIMNNKARQAWELYLKMDTSNDSFNLLQVAWRGVCCCAAAASSTLSGGSV